MDRVFHYITGEVVRYGDRVRAAGHLGRVAEVFQPASHTAVTCRCPEGGVLNLSDWKGVEIASIWTPPDGKSWQDLEFLGREQRRT